MQRYPAWHRGHLQQTCRPLFWSVHGDSYQAANLMRTADAERREKARASLSPSAGGASDEAAAILADLLTEGLKKAVAERVVDYLDDLDLLRDRPHRREGAGCEDIAEAARAVLRLKQDLHDLTAEAVSRALPPEIPDFYRTLVKKIVAKIPLASDAKLEATARGLQVIGIYLCIIQRLPLSECACLRMLARHIAAEQAQHYVESLLEQTARDLRGET
jgi:hypothetical protein